MYVCVYVCVYVCMYVCLYVCVYVCMCACLYVCMYVCLYVCMFVCMYVCNVCVCVLTNTYHWIQLFVLLVEYFPLYSMRPRPPGQLDEDIHWIPGLLLKASTDSIVDKILQLKVMT